MKRRLSIRAGISRLDWRWLAVDGPALGLGGGLAGPPALESPPGGFLSGMPFSPG